MSFVDLRSVTKKEECADPKLGTQRKPFAVKVATIAAIDGSFWEECNQ
jgi:hypothetical protein